MVAELSVIFKKYLLINSYFIILDSSQNLTTANMKFSTLEVIKGTFRITSIDLLREVQ